MIAGRVAFAGFVMLALGTRVHAAPKGPEGVWLGTLDAGKAKLRVAFHVEKKADGAFAATFDSLDEKLEVPVLSIAGEKDLQVPKENSPLIEAALRLGKNPDATVKLLPGLNHLFQHCKTGAPGEYHAIEETFSPEAIQIVGDWIIERAVKLRK